MQLALKSLFLLAPLIDLLQHATTSAALISELDVWLHFVSVLAIVILTLLSILLSRRLIRLIRLIRLQNYLSFQPYIAASLVLKAFLGGLFHTLLMVGEL